MIQPESAQPVGAGKIWTIEGVHGDGETASLDEEDTKLLLLEKEFEDFYEDQVIEIATNGARVFINGCPSNDVRVDNKPKARPNIV